MQILGLLGMYFDAGYYLLYLLVDPERGSYSKD